MRWACLYASLCHRWGWGVRGQELGVGSRDVEQCNDTSLDEHGGTCSAGSCRFPLQLLEKAMVVKQADMLGPPEHLAAAGSNPGIVFFGASTHMCFTKLLARKIIHNMCGYPTTTNPQLTSYHS